MTFSIVGRCARTEMLGVAITSSSICVGSRCPWARAGVGAVTTQNITDPRLGPELLDLLAEGCSAGEAVDRLIEGWPHMPFRQLAVVDARGRTAYHAGAKTLGTNMVVQGADCIAAGNLLARHDVPRVMISSFEGQPDLHLADRLLRALNEGLATGGEEGPVKSAALVVVHEESWPLVDLRVDWHDENPIEALSALWEAYGPQMDDYVMRALNPNAAPSFGVPGDP
jgi:uncharacterized Ntn-hydrolase superfamily protein